MHVVALYHRITAGDTSIVPRTVVFGGKAAPGYVMAKSIIKLIHDVAAMVRADPRCDDFLTVVFVPNYDVSAAEMLFPATEISEQISTAGTEASGTGCMKAVMNGAVIVGTHDGANIEIREEVGDANIFMFGKTPEDLATLRAGGYRPWDVIEADPVLERVIARITMWERHAAIADSLSSSDRYVHCADFASYVATQNQAAQTWTRREDWARISIMNTARSGHFSADRTVAEYARDIWLV
jgi:starch phosphorylase